MAYYDNVNTTLLDAVETSARRIGEFGCSSGTLARAILEKIPDVNYYIGVELIADQLAMAQDVLDIALCRNLDHLEDWSQDLELESAIPLNSFDHIIFGDVLEHLYDPQPAINQAALRLKPGGSVLACIPNVQHWSDSKGFTASICAGR